MISFSGVDCSGKSTQIRLVSSELEKNGIKNKIIWSRGGYTPFLEFLKNCIRYRNGKSKDSQDKIRENVHSNYRKKRLLLKLSVLDLILYYGIYYRFIEIFDTTILADRYLWDSYIDFRIKYQEIDFENWVSWKILCKVAKKPRVSIIYTVPPEVSLQRSISKNDPWPESKEITELRLEHYLTEMENNRWSNVIDATESIQDVMDKTMLIIDSVLKKA